MMDFEKMLGAVGDGESGRQNRRVIADFLAQMILNDPEVPECEKIGLRIMKEGGKLSEKVFELTRRFAVPDVNPNMAEARYTARREALEYILLVSAGIDTFMESHPAFADEV